jgi:putative aminopeptidase FrvX
MALLEKLTSIPGPSGNETQIKNCIKTYVRENAHKWAQEPVIHEGDHLQDCLILAFGRPRTAIFAHMDTIGYMVGHDGRLEAIGKPQAEDGTTLVGKDDEGDITVTLRAQEPDANVPSGLYYEGNRSVAPGTVLTYQPNYQEIDDYIQSPYIDNRAGVYTALKIAESLNDGLICFSCWEEHGGGSVAYLARHIYEHHGVKQALIADITWVTSDIHHGHGPAISLKDRGVPRQNYVHKVLSVASQSGIPYQLEIEGDGGSDGLELQRAPYPFNWCFVGAGETNVHRPHETIHKDDLDNMVALYQYLMKQL